MFVCQRAWIPQSVSGQRHTAACSGWVEAQLTGSLLPPVLPPVALFLSATAADCSFRLENTSASSS